MFWALGVHVGAKLRVLRDCPSLSGVERAEYVLCNLVRFQGFGQGVKRCVAFLIRELEGAPMVSDRVFRAREEEALGGLIRVLVLVLHEPARGIGADGQDGGTQGAVFGGQVAVGAAMVKAGVTDVEDFTRRTCNDESSPKRHGPVTGATGGPVVAGFKVDGERTEGGVLAPVARGDFRVWQAGVDDCVIAQGRDDVGGMGLVQALEGGKVEVVIVVVAEQDRIDFGQVLKRDTRLRHAFWACE